MRALFTLLFGAGMMLFIENKKQNTLAVADAYFRRMMWLLVFGVVDGYLLLWRGDVLYTYALSGILLFAFRNMRARYMLLISFVCVVMMSYLMGKPFFENKERAMVYKETTVLLQQRKKLTAEQTKTREAFQSGVLDNMLPFSPKGLETIKNDHQKDSVLHHSGYPEIFEAHSKDVFEWQSTGMYTGFWEPVGAILLGMALFKLGFFHYRLKISTYRLWCFVGIPIGILLYVIDHKLRVKTQVDLWKMYEWRFFSTLYIENPARLILAVGYAAAIMLLCRIKWLTGFLSLFANVGRMALTNYIMQTVLCSLYFYGFGLNHYGEYGAIGLLVIVVGIWIVQIAYCWIYFKFFETGPLEWLWKRLTYGKRLGFKSSDDLSDTGDGALTSNAHS